MKIWIDAHISPGVAAWINENFDFETFSLRGIGLRDADDIEIFQRARAEDVVFITKDSDFVDLVEVRGAPPKVILLRCGNTTNQRLREIFAAHLSEAIARFDEGEIVVEIE
jgi:predicted nuclease of predicted toxin-antitoxin system